MPNFSFHKAGLAIGGHDILRDLSFSIAPGEWTFLVGPPGAGKTMLLRLAAGKLQATSGRVERTGSAALVLHATPLDDEKSARAILAGAFRAQGASDADADMRAENLLNDLGLEAYFNHEPFRLSRGHRARLAIGAAIAASPALICLDDPFSPMDRAARRKTADALRCAAGEGLAILMVANDPLDVLRYADRIAIMTPGPAAGLAGVHANTPAPEASDDALAESPLYAEVEAALWDE